jgi:hypothetical protein
MFPLRRPPPLSPPPAVGGVNVTSVIIAGVIVGEPQPLPRCRGLNLLLQLVLAVIVVGCHSLEKREFREGESDRFDERERTTLRHLWPLLVAYSKRRLDNGHDASNSL